MAPFPERLSDAPATTKLVWLALDHGGPLHLSALVDQLGLGERTVLRSLSTLAEQGEVATRPSPKDARRTIYELERGD